MRFVILSFRQLRLC